MSYGLNSIQIHKKLRLDKRAGSDNWYAHLTLPSGKRLVKTTKTDDLEAAKEAALRLLDLSVKSFEYLIAKPAIKEKWNGQRSWSGI